MDDSCSAPAAADVPDKPSSLSDKRRSGAGKRVAVAVAAAATATAPAQGLGPCGACKFLRRKCVSGCVFAPYFGSDQGAARFAAVHKVFGASNVSKLLVHVPATQRQDAVLTISYEAQARLSDPVYGCVATILALQQQVASLQAELSMVQTQLLSSRLAVANALQNSQQQNQNHNHHHHQCQQHHNITVLQPEYSNNSSTSTNLMNMGGYPSNFDLASETALSSRSFIKPLHLSRPAQDDDEDEEDSRNNPVIFSNHTLQEK